MDIHIYNEQESYDQKKTDGGWETQIQRHNHTQGVIPDFIMMPYLKDLKDWDEGALSYVLNNVQGTTNRDRAKEGHVEANLRRVRKGDVSWDGILFDKKQKTR